MRNVVAFPGGPGREHDVLQVNPNEGFVGFKTSKPFNAVEIDLGQLASVLGSLNVYGSCVSLQ